MTDRENVPDGPGGGGGGSILGGLVGLAVVGTALAVAVGGFLLTATTAFFAAAGQCQHPSPSTVTARPGAAAGRIGGPGGYSDPVTPAIIGSRFGATGSWARYHTGLDFRAASGQPIRVVTAGTVVYAGNSGDWAGNHVAVQHPTGYTTLYAHMSRIDVSTGQTVQAGDQLGAVGETGRAFGPHLHLEVYPPGIHPGDVYQAIDPQPWLNNLRTAAARSAPTSRRKPPATANPRTDDTAQVETTATVTLPPQGRWSGEQRSIAAAFMAVWRQRRLPMRALEIIVMTGLVESDMTSPDEEHSDRDSAGPLQQRRPYGTEQQRRDPVYAAGKFFDRLIAVENWQKRPRGNVAQIIQVSAYGARYEPKLTDARDLIASITQTTSPAQQPPANADCVDGAVPTTVDDLGHGPVRTVTDPTSGITYKIPIPVGPAGTAINFALDQLGKPYQFGAQGPDTWDCSGLVSKAWKAAGVDVYPQTEQLAKDLPAVTTAQPGDLLYKPGHVQMYLTQLPTGRQLILEAPRTGKDVRIVPQWMTVDRILRPRR